MSVCKCAREKRGIKRVGTAAQKYEKSIEEAVAGVANGFCFFEAGFSNYECSYFCFGNHPVQRDVILISMGGLADYNRWAKHTNCRMLVLRPVEGNSGTSSSTTSEGRWRERTYRMVGGAWLAYPEKENDDTRKVDLPIVEMQLC
jgi:hypothetical protein